MRNLIIRDLIFFYYYLVQKYQRNSKYLYLTLLLTNSASSIEQLII